MSNDPVPTGGIVTDASGISPAVAPDDPILGVWRILGSKGGAPGDRSERRYGARAPRIEDFAEWRFSPEGRGLRTMAVSAGAGAERQPSVSYFSTLDGRPWADPFGPAFLGQLIQQWRLDPHLLLRLVLDNVAPPERRRWTILEIAADGATMVATSWDDGAPNATMVTTFSREGEPQAVKTMAPGEWRIGDGLTLRRSTTAGGFGGVVREFAAPGGAGA